MSLLLNALKKAEEGEKNPAAENAAASPAAAPALAPAAPAAPAAAVDFDSIEDDGGAKPGGKSLSLASAGAAAGAATGAEKRARVDAARVFSASEDGGGGAGPIKRFFYFVFGMAALGGGGYFVVSSGLIPGVDMRAITTLLGLQEAQVAVAPAPAAVELEISDDVVLLPVPAVDIQSKVDFAALRLPENNRARIGEAEYMQRIAYLTGFDFDKERTRVQEEERELIVELDIRLDDEDETTEEQPVAEVEIADPFAELDASEIETAVIERPIETADSSRADKFRLDAATPSDKELQAAIRGDSIAMVADPAAKDGNAEAEAAAAAEAAAQVAQAAEVEVKQSQEGAERQRLIEQAQTLYNRGAYLEAEAVFRSVLASAPTSRNALRGIAQIAVITGRYQTAVATYLDLLGYYPNDPIAIAELTNLRGENGDFYEMEKALKDSLGKMPAADGRLYFSLGNLYAQNGRLRDAQHAYFQAFSRESENPDYAYNLAVLLDHLNKPALALRYYEEALQNSQGVPVGFSRAEVRARINDLQ